MSKIIDQIPTLGVMTGVKETKASPAKNEKQTEVQSYKDKF